jgi:ribose transport system substrate-binding protein
MRIAVFTKNRTNPAYASARLGADRAAARLDATVDHYVPEKPDDPEEQSALIDRALSTSPDAIVISAVHPTRVDEAIRRIEKAGVPIVGFINPVGAAHSVCYVGADDSRLGSEIAEYLFRDLDGEGSVLIVTGPEHSPTSQDRLRGFLAAAGRWPRVNLVGQVAGDYSQATAKSRVADWIRSYGSPQAFLVANDAMAIGILEAMDEARCHAAVVGVNAIPQAVSAVGQGRMLATADFNAMQIAALATECAIRHVRGERVPSSIELPVHIVDGANWREWDRPYEDRPILSLSQIGAMK